MQCIPKNFIEKMYTLLFFYVVAFLGITDSTDSDSKIKSGTIAGDGQFPFQVSMRIKNVHQCAGSIINSKTIVTVAHCLVDQHFQYKFELYVIAGSNKLQTGGVSYEIRRLIVHDYFGRNKNQHDVGLVQLHKEINFDTNTKPIEIVPEPAIPKQTVVCGWGLTGPAATTRENDLMYATLDMMSINKCNKILGKQHGSTMCATALNTKFCVDCGGAVTFEGKLFGIVIYGKHNCMPNSVTIVINVYHVNDWIQNNIRE